jgi:hypothetical protein
MHMPARVTGPLSTKMWADALVERVEEAKAAIEEWIDFLEN